MKVKHLLALILSMVMGGISFIPTTNSVYANTYQTQNITKQDVADMINLGADFGFEGVQNMNNGDTEKAYQNFNKALQYLGKAENYLNQTTEVFDKEKYKNSITTTKSSILAKMEQIKKQPSTPSTQSSTNSTYYNTFSKNSEIGMKYANECLDYVSSGNYVEVVKIADTAIDYLTKALQNLEKVSDYELGTNKETAIEDLTYVLAILYSEKAKGEIEYYNKVSSGKINLENAININSNVAADTINSLARKAIENKKYDAANIYINKILNSTIVSSSSKTTARKLKSLIPQKRSASRSKVDIVLDVLDLAEDVVSEFEK